MEIIIPGGLMDSTPNNMENKTFRDLYDKSIAHMTDNKTNLVVERSDSNNRFGHEAYKINFDGSTERGSTSVTNTNLIKDRVGACREMYENVGIIGNIIDIMVDFALEGVTFVHESKPIENFYRNWQNKVHLRKILENVLKCIFRDANVPILTRRGTISKEEVSRYRKAFAQDSIFVSETPQEALIPYEYEILDFLRFDKDGGDLLNMTRYTYRIATSDIKMLKQPRTQSEKSRVETLRNSMTQEEWDYLLKTNKMILDPSRVNVLYYKKDDFKKWANPLLWRVVGDVKFKSLLRDMDISVVESVTNALVVIKLGNTPEGFPPRKEEFSKMVSMLKNPTKSKTIVWNDLIEIIDSYPPVEKILGKEKYEQVDDDIRSGLGISEILVNGEGGNYANSYLSVKTLMERLEGARETLLEWLESESVKIAKAMKFRKPATVRMRHMSLLNAEAERQFMLELYDHHLLSAQTLLSNVGENPEVEMKRMKEEDDVREGLQDDFPFVLRKVDKYNPSIISQDGKDNGEIKESPSSQGPRGEAGGRPNGEEEGQRDVKNVRPQGSKTAASIVINKKYYLQARSRFDVLYKMFAKALVKKRRYNVEIDMTDEDREIIYSAIDKIMCSLLNKEDYTEDNIKAILSGDMELATAPAKLDRCVKNVKKQRVEKFKEEKGRSPNKKEMEEITSSAFAICRSQLDL